MSEPIAVATPGELARAVLYHGVRLAEVHGIAPGELEAVYSKAHEDLLAGRLHEALEQLAFLVQYAHDERRYIFAFAYCLHSLGQYEEAGSQYAQAMLLDATDAMCAFRLGECHGALGQLAEAREAFDACVKLSWASGDFADVREAAVQRLDALTAMGA